MCFAGFPQVAEGGTRFQISDPIFQYVTPDKNE